MNKHKYDWIIVGGGAAGIAIGEILSRLNLDVLIIEKNEKLAGETTGLFHEWLHTGSLYTLTPDKLETTKYLLGALDDLLIYYSFFDKMNIKPSEKGFEIEKDGWFNDENILYKYRNRPFNPLWSIIVARSLRLINEIKQHDWLRKRAGSKFDKLNFNLKQTMKLYPLAFKDFTEVVSPDITINSRNLLSDLIKNFLRNNCEILTKTIVNRVNDSGSIVYVETDKGRFSASKVALCCADGISKFTNTKLNISYAPMFVVESLDKPITSFVELDLFTNNCINMIKKTSTIGLAGGISVKSKTALEDYSNFCIKSHLKLNNSLKFLGRYIGLKKELVQIGKNRNYLFHIDNISENTWTVVLGKFTLMFSLAPEFIRRVYKKNVNINLDFKSNKVDILNSDIPIAETEWKRIMKTRRI